jgi:hypothetical protein
MVISYKITGRVKHKTSISNYSKSTKDGIVEGCLFKIKFFDNTGFVKITFFDVQAKQYYDMIHENQV